MFTNANNLTIIKKTAKTLALWGEPVRIIAGSARRTALVAPKGQNTRPTADRIKENLFNIISPHIPGARFLDLFCGSGAIGIEALSRGTGEAVFVDISKDAVSVTQANLARAKLTGHVMQGCSFAAISQFKQQGRAFDIIFLDPPYGLNLLGSTLAALEESCILSPEGIVVTECHVDEPQPQTDSFILQDTREYGSTRIMLYRYQ